MTERQTIRVEGAPKQPNFLSHAVRFGDLVYTSGAAPRVPATHEIPEGFEAQARQTFENLETVLSQRLGELINPHCRTHCDCKVCEAHPLRPWFDDNG